MTTGKHSERTKLDFRCSIYRSAIGQASCLICASSRQLALPFCCQISLLLTMPTRDIKYSKHPHIKTLRFKNLQAEIWHYASSRPISLTYQFDSRRLLVAHLPRFRVDQQHSWPLQRWLQHVLSLHNPQERLHSACCKPSVFGEYNLCQE